MIRACKRYVSHPFHCRAEVLRGLLRRARKRKHAAVAEGSAGGAVSLCLLAAGRADLGDDARDLLPRKRARTWEVRGEPLR